MADLPVYFSNQVAEKTGTPNTGKLIAGDWSQVMLGIWSRSRFAGQSVRLDGLRSRRCSRPCDGDLAQCPVRQPTAFVFAEDIAI